MCSGKLQRLILCSIDKKSVYEVRMLGVTYICVGIIMMVGGGLIVVPHMVHELSPINSELHVDLVNSSIVTYKLTVGVQYNSKFIILEPTITCFGNIFEADNCTKAYQAKFIPRDVYCRESYSCSYEKYTKQIIITIIGTSIFSTIVLILFCIAMNLFLLAKHQTHINRMEQELL